MKNQTSRELYKLFIPEVTKAIEKVKLTVYWNPSGAFATYTVGEAYQRSLDIADLDPNYVDSNGRTKADSILFSKGRNFIPPIPIFDDPPKWELGGYDPSTWTGHAPITSFPLADGSFPPEMKPSKVLQIMSESFDDEGDVSTFEVQAGWKNISRRTKIYTASGAGVGRNFNPDAVQREKLFLLPHEYIHHSEGKKPRPQSERYEITDRLQSGKPNFAGSSNIQGVEVIAIVALVGVESYQKFVDAFESLKGLFGGMPSLTEFADDIAGIYAKANAEVGTPMTITNNTVFGDFQASTDAKPSFIVGQRSGAKAKILEIVKTENLVMKKLVTRYQKVDTAGSEAGTGWFPSINTEKTTGEDVIVFTDLVDDNEAGRFKKLDIKVKMLPDSIKFMPDETIFEGVQVTVGPPGKVSKR